MLASNITYNLTTIIKSNIHLSWNINFFYTFLQMEDLKLLFGTILLELSFILFFIRNDKLKIFKKKKDMPKEDGSFEYGSSKWATNKDIKKKYKVWNIGKHLSSGGIPITYIGDKFYYSDSFDHTLIIGSTGSGKTLCEIMPLIFNLGYAGESMVINDVKGELYSNTYEFLKNENYKIQILNLRDALSSDGWNPLHLAYTYYKEGNLDSCGEIVENFAKSLTSDLSSKDKYWEKSATSVLSALCYALIEDCNSESEVHLFSIYNLLVEHGAKMVDRTNSLDLYFQQKPLGNIAKNSYATGSFAKGETRATLFSVLATCLKLFSDIGIANLTSRTDFELDSIGKEKTAIFLIIPDEKESRHQLASLFVDQCYQALVNSAQSYSNGKMPIRVNFILDEFSNMPRISSMSNKITVSRSRNIRFYMVIQDFNQLKEKYKEDAGTIKSNATNWIYLLTADNDTAKEISSRLGKYTISSSRTSTSQSKGNSLNVSNDKNLMGRELLMPEELMRLSFGEAIFMTTRMHPIKANIKPINEYPIKVKKVDLPKEIRKYDIDCFDLNKYRKEKIKTKENYKIDLM